MENQQVKVVLTISGVVERAKAEGIPLTEYTLRRAIRMGAIPCRVIGKKYLIAWQNVLRWINCEDSQDIKRAEEMPEYFEGVRENCHA